MVTGIITNMPGILSDRRAGYLVALATGVADDAETLSASWSEGEGTFGSAFVNATAPFTSQKEVGSDIRRHLLYRQVYQRSEARCTSRHHG